MEVASHAQLRDLDFIGAEDFARPADGVILRMPEIIGVVDVCPDLRRKELRIHREIFRSGIAVKPGEVAKCEGLRFAWFSSAGHCRGLSDGYRSHRRLCHNGRGNGGRRSRRRGGCGQGCCFLIRILSGAGRSIVRRCRLVLQLTFELLDARTHALQLLEESRILPGDDAIPFRGLRL